MYKLGADTGGTFTDIGLIDEQSGRISVTKVPSTPENPAVAVLAGIKAITEQMGITCKEIDFFIHGTTVATNALLELKGAKTALITTEGFKDVLHIARQTRPKLYDFWAKRPKPQVPRSLRFEVPERILYTGDILKPLDTQAVRDIAQQLKKENVEAVAICLLHSYANSVHEKQIKDILQEMCPDITISISSEILSEYREYERMSTVTINAYVMPKVNRYVSHLAGKLKEMGVKSDLYIMQSNGGVITAETAREASARTVLSGPAGGALAGIFVCQQTKTNNIITVDMGGTSLDICLVENRKPKYTTESQIGGYPIKLPMIDIHTIGAGGGSIAWIDEGGALRVGPESAGAVPGPVCYQKGGQEPTVTDANAVLGRLNPHYILGGQMEMDVENAKKAIKEKIADPLNLTIEEAAMGIIRIVNANMVRGIRVVSVENGHDPREFSLVSFGGAGPIHAVEMARELAMKEVIIPVNPGITSAIGMLTADVRHDYVQTYITSTDNLDLNKLEALYNQLETEAASQLAAEGFKNDNAVLLRTADMRYSGQSFELGVSVPAGELKPEHIKAIEAQFHDMHMKQYGYQRPGETIELVNLRLVALGKLPGLTIKDESALNRTKPDADTYRDVYFDNDYVSTAIYNRDTLLPGQQITGPAIIEQLDSTTVIFPGQKARIDAFDNILISLHEEV
jgi:N-methylhydantoinase A